MRTFLRALMGKSIVEPALTQEQFDKTISEVTEELKRHQKDLIESHDRHMAKCLKDLKDDGG